MGTECINCGWTEAGSLLSHEEYVTARERTAWLCISYANGTVLPPRASGEASGGCRYPGDEEDQPCYHECDENCFSHDGTDHDCPHAHCFNCGECQCAGYCDDYHTYNLRPGETGGMLT